MNQTFVYLPYVLQEHESEGSAGLHFDLRIKYAKISKLASWAIPKARIPVDNKNAVLAVRTQDHDMSWLKFQGTIGKGYGKGYVRILQTGLLKLNYWYENKIISFEVDQVEARYMFGKYILVRNKRYDQKNNTAWFLVKSKKS